MSGKNSTSVENVSSLPQLSKDVLGLLDRQSPFSDAVLKCGGAEIPVHRCILSARSQVFAAMFQSGMQEVQSGGVNIVDIELGVLQVLLRYLYSGNIESLTDTIAEELLFAADKYELQDLKRICTVKLVSVLSVDNAIRILILGHLHDSCLKERAKEFICKCKFSELEGKEEWESLQEQYSKLAMEVMRSVVKYMQESSDRKESSAYKIEIRFVDNPGKSLSLEVSVFDTIENIKQKIQVDEGIPPHHQRLFFNSRLLEDTSTLSDCAICNNSVLFLIRCMEIFVQTFNGDIITLHVENARSCTVRDVKVKIQRKKGVAPDFQRLLYVSKQLEDERTLADYNITNYSTLQLLPKIVFSRT